MENQSREPFSIDKFKDGMFSLINKVQWSKDITSIINVRKLIIYLVIVIGFAGYWYWQGKKTKPIQINCPALEGFHADVIGKSRDKHSIDIKGGQMLFDEKPVVNGQLAGVKPYGLSFQPELISSYGKFGKSIGLGAEIIYFYDLNLDVFGSTDKTANIGISYDLKQFSSWLNNSSLGVSYGKKIGTGETDYKAYFKLKF